MRDANVRAGNLFDPDAPLNQGQGDVPTHRLSPAEVTTTSPGWLSAMVRYCETFTPEGRSITEALALLHQLCGLRFCEEVPVVSQGDYAGPVLQMRFWCPGDDADADVLEAELDGSVTTMGGWPRDVATDVLLRNNVSNARILRDSTGTLNRLRVLGGNGTGPITGGATIGLASEVTSTLPVPNGGTGATTLTGVLGGNGTGAITGGASVSLTSDVTGILPVANGETGGGSTRPVPFPVAFNKAGPRATSVWTQYSPAPVSFTIQDARAAAHTVPVGQSIIIDVLVNSVSIFGGNQADMIDIPSGEAGGVSETMDYAVVEGDLIGIEIEQCGSPTAGGNITVVVNGRASFQE